MYLAGWTSIVIVLLLAIHVVPLVAALVSIARAESPSGTERAVWVLAVIIAPIVGALAWFAIGRRSRQSQKS